MTRWSNGQQAQIPVRDTLAVLLSTEGSTEDSPPQFGVGVETVLLILWVPEANKVYGVRCMESPPPAKGCTFVGLTNVVSDLLAF